ncbi:ABC transporter substrate-binding protein [Thiotrichales bacterium 19S3-7]|nr:ABC transporter substrate-binding protein [Thiotrichales bacterium 19S3-7]MCF6801010.1 ABC transporter substrate-binding protein [Thiotrichales bacterium 19S3-11]
MKQLKLIIISILTLSLVSVSYAEATTKTTTVVTDQNSTDTINPNDPVSIIEGSFVKLQKLVSQQSEEINKDPQILVHLVNQYFVPYIDQDVMAGYAVGIKWRTATEKEKQEFIKQFITLLARFYAKTVTKVGDYQLKISPISQSAIQDKKYISVNGKIINKTNGNASPIEIKMIRSDHSWKTYDIVVGGVSILNNYREQFQQAANMSQLITRLTQMNAKGAQ